MSTRAELRGMSGAMARRGDGKGRGSPEAVEKRRSARALNALFSAASGGLDGRTERRRKRLLAELKDGRGGEALSAIEVLTHAAEPSGLKAIPYGLLARGSAISRVTAPAGFTTERLASS